MADFRDTTRIYFKFWGKYKKYYLPPVFLSPIGVISSQFVPPIIVGLVLDKLASGNLETLSFGDFVPLLLILFFFRFIVAETTFRSMLWFMIRGSAKGMSDLHAYVFNDLINRDIAFHNNSFGGALVAKEKRFVSSFERLYDIFVFDIISSVTAVIITFGYLIWALPGLAVFLLIISVPYVWLLLKLGKIRAELNKKSAAADSLVTANIADSITNISAVKSYAHEKYEDKRFSETRTKWVNTSVKAWDYQNIPTDLVSGIISALLFLITLIAAIVAVLNGLVNIGVVYVAITYVGNITRRLWEMNRIFRNVEKAYSESYEMTDILNQPHKVADKPSARSYKINRGDISFKDVEFQYTDGSKSSEPVLKDFNLDIKSGEKIGLVGRSGSGKTTLTKILLRYDDIQKGKISIDSRDISKIKQSSLRHSIAYVPQEPVLFHRTISENIGYGNPSLDQSEIVKAAKLAHAEEFIKDLPNSYQTLVGERGVKLSGGQRQRVAIARAIVKDAPILVLDEATSSLDSESEKYIQDALNKLMKSRTSIVVAHRLSTIQAMDRIIVMEQGEIIEQGTHKELLELKGQYADLWSHQSGGFLES